MIVSLPDYLDAAADPPPAAVGEPRRALHIRCGSDIRERLAAAGFRGDFLAFYDPLVHGPLPRSEHLDDYLDTRARYIAGRLAPDFESVLADLRGQYAALEQAADYDAVYLWFEHDAWDQTILARLLAAFADEVKTPPQLWLVSVTGYPGIEPFRGLGQLWPAALLEIWQTFAAVNPAQLELGCLAWDALRAPTPAPLEALIAAGTPALPTLAIALDRYLGELPSTFNGLGLTANLLLRALDEGGPLTAGRLFGKYQHYYEPLPYLGDTAFGLLLDVLVAARHPPIALTRAGDNRWSASVELTASGGELLAGHQDWIELNGIDEWLGGIHLDSAGGMVYRRAL